MTPPIPFHFFLFSVARRALNRSSNSLHMLVRQRRKLDQLKTLLKARRLQLHPQRIKKIVEAVDLLVIKSLMDGNIVAEDQWAVEHGATPQRTPTLRRRQTT